MRVKQNDDNFDVEVYGVYWVNNVLYVYVIPEPDYGGFAALREGEFTITNPYIDNFKFCQSSAGGGRFDLFIHKCALDDDILYGLVDHDPEAMAEFHRRLSALR